jgi:hypothetical protein
MSCPLVSVSGVRVSLQVITMHPIDLGAWLLCSWAVWLPIHLLDVEHALWLRSHFAQARDVLNNVRHFEHS